MEVMSRLSKQIYRVYRVIIVVHEEMMVKFFLQLNNMINEYVEIFQEWDLNRCYLLAKKWNENYSIFIGRRNENFFSSTNYRIRIWILCFPVTPKPTFNLHRQNSKNGFFENAAAHLTLTFTSVSENDRNFYYIES